MIESVVLSLANKALGERIKTIREKLGKSQTEFGQLFDPPAPKSAVSRWEHGGSPNKKRLSDIAKMGGISVEELIYGTLEESIYNILNEIHPLYSKWLSVTNDSSWEKFVSLGENEEQRSIYRNLSRMFSLLEVDNYGPYITTGKDISGELEVCARIALGQAKVLKISPSNKPMLIRLMLEAAERHWTGETATNTGVFHIINNELNNAREKISDLTYKIGKNEEGSKQAKHSTKINKEYIEEINSLIDETQQRVYKISSKYNVK